MNQGEVSISVPFGSVMNSQIFSTTGPVIQMYASPYAQVNVDIDSEFTSAGINQTSHQITMDLQSKIALSIPGYMTTVTVDSSFLIAETVLVGKVPDSYTEVDGTQADLLGKIFAFGGDSA